MGSRRLEGEELPRSWTKNGRGKRSGWKEDIQAAACCKKSLIRQQVQQTTSIAQTRIEEKTIVKTPICTLNAINDHDDTLSQTPRPIPQSIYPIRSLSLPFISASPHAADTASQAQSAAKPSPNLLQRNATHLY